MCTVANHVEKHFLVKQAWGGGVFIIVTVSRSNDSLFLCYDACWSLWPFTCG